MVSFRAPVAPAITFHPDDLQGAGHIYESNPSVAGGRFRTRLIGSKATEGRKAYMIAPDTHEVIGEGTFGFVEEKEVDCAQFGKVYLDETV
jgi:hypothetical protein